VLCHRFTLEDFAAVGMHFELAVAVDVAQMGFDRCRAFSPA
jgi:hypothetical protein